MFLTHRFGLIIENISTIAHKPDIDDVVVILSTAKDVGLHWFLLKHHPVAKDVWQGNAAGATSNKEKHQC